MSPRLRFAVVAGGAVGTLARWGLSLLPETNGLPTGTLVANVLGALALGLVVGRLGEEAGQPRWTPLTAGVLGASTTFATLVVEVVDLWSRAPVTALVYVSLSVALGLTAVALGRSLSAGAHT